jgi:SAM-dependent methyltransferase
MGGTRMDDYPRAFYDELKETALPSARRIVPLLRELMTVASAVDVGCGDGGWLKALAETGTQTVLGLDGDWMREDQLLIGREQFVRCALTERLPVEDRFDLAISLEVAEHIPAGNASAFVAELTRLSPVVLFSAAVPDQGGLNHVNEQWPAYWAALFGAHGYQTIDTLRWRIWSDDGVTWWYKQNLLLFASEAALTSNPKLEEARQASPQDAPLAVVHPDRFGAVARLTRPGFGRWLKMGKAALGRSLRRTDTGQVPGRGP